MSQTQRLFARKWLQRTGSDESIASSASAETQRHNAKLGPLPSPCSRGGGGANLSAAEKPFVTATAAAAWSGPKLAQEIHNEFLVCKICLDGYKTPKCLDCLHTFCEQCVENHVTSESSYKKYSDYREFTCPLCRKRTALPVGGVRRLPDNFLVSSLAEMVGRQRPSSSQPPSSSSCDVCRAVGGRQREAIAKCIDCAKLLCCDCVATHGAVKVTSAHSVCDVETEKEIECKQHQGEVIRFYCEPCDACVCVLCTFLEHRDHAMTQFTEAVVKHRQSVRALVGRCRSKVDQYDAQVEALTKCEQTVLAVEQVVHDTAIRFVQEIRNRENRLIEELQEIYGQKLMEAIRNKKYLVAQAETLRSTCSLADVILIGKDLELLLLKKEVEEKLNALNSLELGSLPDAVNKVVEFAVGSVDLGHIHDHDHDPPPSDKRIRRTNTPDTNSDHVDEIIRGSQEDPQTTKQENPESKDNDSSSSDPDSDSDLDDGERKSKGDSKAEVKETGAQTEEPDDSSSSSSSSDDDDEDDDGPETEERGTMTDSVETEDRGVNTTKKMIDDDSVEDRNEEDASQEFDLGSK